MSRLFAFGCSFTQYQWPTWADILGQNFDLYENWGRLGAGNHYIFNALMECMIKHSLQETDTVAIMWTNVTRTDIYGDTGWMCRGNQFGVEKPTFENQQSLRGFYIKDLAMIHAAKIILDTIGCRYHMLSMVDLANPGEYNNSIAVTVAGDLFRWYHSVLSVIKPSIHKTIFNYEWGSRPLHAEKARERLQLSYVQNRTDHWPSWEDFQHQNFYDSIPKRILKEMFNLNKWNWLQRLKTETRTDHHASPAEHLEYLDIVLPDYQFATETRSLVHEIDVKIRQQQPYQELLPRFRNDVTRPIIGKLRL